MRFTASCPFGDGGPLLRQLPAEAERIVGEATGILRLTCHRARMPFKIGDQVKWSSHGGEAQGKVVRVAHEDGEVSGFHYRASQEDPRYIVELEDGKQTAHTEQALSKA